MTLQYTQDIATYKKELFYHFLENKEYKVTIHSFISLHAELMIDSLLLLIRIRVCLKLSKDLMERLLTNSRFMWFPLLLPLPRQPLPARRKILNLLGIRRNHGSKDLLPRSNRFPPPSQRILLRSSLHRIHNHLLLHLIFYLHLH